MAANDISGQVGNNGTSGEPLDFRTQKFQTPPAQTTAQTNAQYDEEGYPLPTAEQIKAAQYGNTFSNGQGQGGAGGTAYDPALPAPQPDSDNPFPPGSNQYEAWRSRNTKLKNNAAAKKAWQQQHEEQRQKAPEAPVKSAAPATPFQSSGVDLTKQGKGESYIDSILKSYEESGVPQLGNESKSTLDAYRAAGPSGETKQTLDAFRSQQPANMDPYYDYASKLASAKIDNAMASRGSYGSSNAIGQLGAAEVALRAQQARDNASYGLQRFAQEGSLAGAADNQRNAYWGQQGQLAGAADNQSNIQNGVQFQWTKGLADLATKSQEMGQDRNQQLWNNNFQLAAARAGIYGTQTGAAINDVGAATDAAANAKQGNATDALSIANANANQQNGYLSGMLNSANQGVSNYTKFKAGN